MKPPLSAGVLLRLAAIAAAAGTVLACGTDAQIGPTDAASPSDAASDGPDAAPGPDAVIVDADLDARAVPPPDAHVVDAAVPDAHLAPDAHPIVYDAALPDARPPMPDAMPPPPPGPDAGPPPDPNNCSDLFNQNILPIYEMEFSSSEWAAITDEFLHWAERERQGLPPDPYHPVSFRYQGGPWIPNVQARLKGQSSWHETVAFDSNPRMQFTVSFNNVDHTARFHGIRKLEFDMPRNDWSFLRQRLAVYWLRVSGYNGQCANNARLYINGSYYGLFTALERMDKEFLQRVFPMQGGGDLWDGGKDIKTNEETFSFSRIIKFWLVSTTEELERICDLAFSVKVWAAEAMLNDADGYYGGIHNYYLYDHPTRGFVWLSHDLDAAFDYQPYTSPPIYWSRAMEPVQHYLIVMHDPAWLQRYVSGLAEAWGKYNPDVLTALVDQWGNQIHDAAQADPHRPFSMSEHIAQLSWLQSAIIFRSAFIGEWLHCWSSGGPDYDGDGYDSCHDCDNDDDRVHPGAGEVCNGLDDDCDGRIDEKPDDRPMNCP